MSWSPVSRGSDASTSLYHQKMGAIQHLGAIISGTSCERMIFGAFPAAALAKITIPVGSIRTQITEPYRKTLVCLRLLKGIIMIAAVNFKIPQVYTRECATLGTTIF